MHAAQLHFVRRAAFHRALLVTSVPVAGFDPLRYMTVLRCRLPCRFSLLWRPLTPSFSVG